MVPTPSDHARVSCVGLWQGAEGGTGAAPPEFSNSVGTPLIEGLVLMDDLLKGVGLRDRVKIIASGKVRECTELWFPNPGLCDRTTVLLSLDEEKLVRKIMVQADGGSSGLLELCADADLAMKLFGIAKTLARPEGC